MRNSINKKFFKLLPGYVRFSKSNVTGNKVLFWIIFNEYRIHEKKKRFREYHVLGVTKNKYLFMALIQVPSLGENNFIMSIIHIYLKFIVKCTEWSSEGKRHGNFHQNRTFYDKLMF